MGRTFSRFVTYLAFDRRRDRRTAFSARLKPNTNAELEKHYEPLSTAAW